MSSNTNQALQIAMNMRHRAIARFAAGGAVLTQERYIVDGGGIVVVTCKGDVNQTRWEYQAKGQPAEAITEQTAAVKILARMQSKGTLLFG